MNADNYDLGRLGPQSVLDHIIGLPHVLLGVASYVGRYAVFLIEFGICEDVVKSTGVGNI